VITVQLENGFPLDATITLALYDENWVKVDELLSSAAISSGSLNANCIVSTPVISKIDLKIDQNRMTQFKLVKHAILTAVLNTSKQNTCNGQYLKIYDSYLIKTNITAKFNYNVNAF